MDKESGTNRWWENYLVRYLMPSIAGVAIVSWLCAQGGDDLRQKLYLPPHTSPLGTPSLTLLFLYGNLFCYVASYPVLVFHATRAIDLGDSGPRGGFQMGISQRSYLRSSVCPLPHPFGNGAFLRWFFNRHPLSWHSATEALCRHFSQYSRRRS